MVKSTIFSLIAGAFLVSASVDAQATNPEQELAPSVQERAVAAPQEPAVTTPQPAPVSAPVQAPAVGAAQEPAVAVAQAQPVQPEPSAPDEGHRSVALHAPTLAQGEIVLGLWRFEVGIFDFLSVGTSLPFWVAGLPFGTTFPNGYLRAALPVGDHFTLGARVGFTYANLGRVYASLSDGESDLRSKLVIVPLTLLASVHGEHFALTLKTIYTVIGGDGAAPLDQSSGVGGVAYADTLQLQVNASARVARQLAFVAQLRYLPYHGPFIVGVDVASNDTRIRGELELNIEGLQHSIAALAGIHLTFGVFNLYLAAGWGSIFLPDLGLVVPAQTAQFDFDLYFRF